MGKIIRQKDQEGTEHSINLDTGEIDKLTIDAWEVSVQQRFVKCCSLVEQITEKKLNLIDETTVRTIAHSLVEFNERGKSLFFQVCLFQTSFDTDSLSDIWNKATRTSKIKSYAFIKACREKGLEVITDEEFWTYMLKDPGGPSRNITDELSEKDVEHIREFHHLEYSNCYYFARYEKDESKSNCILEKKSNFVLNILYHITRGKINKRVVVLKNNRNREVTLDIETNQITSFTKFKEVTEGAGNFLFEGSQIELNKIKNKLFEQEKPCTQIETLGWNKKGFYTYSNGIWTDSFIEVDKYGIVSLEDTNYYIPYHPGTEESTSLNEKKFLFKQSSVNWEQWAQLYVKAFGDAAMVCQVFAVATLFSDAIFQKKNNFPMIFLYGEGGSGKSTVVNYLQYLFGLPQPALKLSERANTDKAKIRKLAQFSNAIACMEEYINDQDLAVKKTLTGLYDRLGYERGTLESKFGTETVPIQSTVIITGNEYPDDDPLMQRLIILDYNHNKRSAEVNESFYKLTELNRVGITTVTGELLKYRKTIIENFDSVYRSEFTAFKKQYKGPSVPDRMIENNALILAVYKIMQNAGLVWSFTYNELLAYLIKTVISQADKRDTGAVLQTFWNIVSVLLKDRKIRNGREIKIDGNTVSIRFKEIHHAYLDEHNRVYRSRGLAANTLLQRLKDSPAFRESKSNQRFGVDVTSSFVFDYTSLNVDMLSTLEYQTKEDLKYTSREESNQNNSSNDRKIDNEASKSIQKISNNDLPF